MQVFKLKRYDLDDVKRLIEIAKKNDLAVLEIESKKGRRIRIEKSAPGTPAVTFSAGIPAQAIPQDNVAQPVQPIAQAAQSAPAAAAPAVTAEAKATETVKTIDAPMVGVFYKAPSPDAEPYVTVGKHVSKGDIICIIEAMKLMNEIKAEEDGVIAEVLVNDGDIVEFGKPMFALK
ncbi:MAG: acetyl-CoA carboxylase biotin carboxyl carrier protein [Ruminococcus sp.]|nr:acetyl-CoA carboxylase biotin carboxyl carrier protein [Ruminococcus sp.]